MNRLGLTRDPKNLQKVLYRRTDSENSKISWKKYNTVNPVRQVLYF